MQNVKIVNIHCNSCQVKKQFCRLNGVLVLTVFCQRKALRV